MNSALAAEKLRMDFEEIGFLCSLDTSNRTKDIKFSVSNLNLAFDSHLLLLSNIFFTRRSERQMGLESPD